MRLGSHRKVPLEFLSEPPFRSYVQSKTVLAKRGETPVFHIIAPRTTGGFFSDRYPERTTPNKNTRFGPKDAPHKATDFGPSRVFLFGVVQPPERTGFVWAVWLDWTLQQKKGSSCPTLKRQQMASALSCNYNGR